MHRVNRSVKILRAALGLLAALELLACGSEDEIASTDDAVTAADGESDEQSGFEQCLESVNETCMIAEMHSLEEIEAPCFDMKFISIPLSDGGTHGPVTVPGGPYGAIVDWNVGTDTDFVNPVNSLEPACLPFGIDTFAEPAEVTDVLKDTRDLDYSLYTIFRPACMKDGEKYPVITWANGTCGLTHGYAALLGSVASHGFIVIASNSSWTATPPTNNVQLRALDYAEALNQDPDSVYYQKLDLDRTGAMGHSQGSAATAVAAADPRIKAVILWNGGASNDKPFLFVSGDRDMNDIGPEGLGSATNDATQPGAWLYYHQVLETGGNATGHLVLMEQPERVWEVAVAWWEYMLNGDEEAKKMFTGDDCGLCGKPDEFEYGHNDLLE